MSNPDQNREWMRAQHAQKLEHDRLIQLIAGLANCLDRKFVIETVEAILRVKSVEKGDCVHFDDLALRFGDDGRLLSLYRVIDGTTRPADVKRSGD
ncbi:MAG: hypothetical protein ACE5FV_00735 [Woeseia sp.]